MDPLITPLIIGGVVLAAVLFFVITARASVRSQPTYSWQNEHPREDQSLGAAWSRMFRWLAGKS